MCSICSHSLLPPLTPEPGLLFLRLSTRQAATAWLSSTLQLWQKHVAPVGTAKQYNTLLWPTVTWIVVGNAEQTMERNQIFVIVNRYSRLHWSVSGISWAVVAWNLIWGWACSNYLVWMLNQATLTLACTGSGWDHRQVWQLSHSLQKFLAFCLGFGFQLAQLSLGGLFSFAGPLPHTLEFSWNQRVRQAFPQLSSKVLFLWNRLWCFCSSEMDQLTSCNSQAHSTSRLESSS